MKKAILCLFLIAVSAFAQALTITTTALPVGNTTAAYNQTLAAAGGTAPYTWSISSGSLPAGLTLSSAGAITGTATAYGSFPITVGVTDSAATPATATASLTLSVASPWGPYDAPTAVTICQVDTTQTPVAIVNDSALGVPRCFVVPQALSIAMVRYMLTQTAGLKPDGSVAYTYASWWDYIVKFFINNSAMPILTAFPPPNVAQAQAQAAAAAAAVDAAKAAIVAGQGQQ